ncbi:hypothetical protein FIBSPDRAFT_905332 [Athelia psychrophila]|uniref:F-box domain-containing protein n=1 Tax=Athelia psychrophila TaxID=1759441 RepID=A0A167TK74_9AGAM|nr:hypothetical protein FIBSPDRAFT_905332 [Fibularhizoctonia sp. CBS 109695]
MPPLHSYFPAHLLIPSKQGVGARLMVEEIAEREELHPEETAESWNAKFRMHRTGGTWLVDHERMVEVVVYVCGVSRQLRVLALGLLWERVDNTNRCARRMLKGMLRNAPPPEPLASYSHRITPSHQAHEAQEAALRSQMLPLIRHFRAACPSVMDLLRAGELADLRSFHLNWIGLQKGYAGDFAGRLPNLRQLGLPVSAPSPGDGIIQLFRDIVEAAPQLDGICLSGQINGFVLDQTVLVPRLESLELSDHAYFAAALKGPWIPIEPLHLRKLSLSGIQEFIIAMFQAIRNTTITHLRIRADHLRITTALDNSSIVMAGVMAYPSLTHLHLVVSASGEEWSGPRILTQLHAIPNLTSFTFSVSGYLCPQEPANLGSAEAEYMCNTWPNLRAVGVKLADHGFFLAILNLQHLQELELNAWYWVEGPVDASDAPHTALCSLCFRGCPPRWANRGSTDLNLKRFPNLQGPEIIHGDGGAPQLIPNGAD